MNKTVLVINGAGGVGKDTLCAFAARHFRVRNVSSVTPIKELARRCGWTGGKEDRDRRFLSDLKRLTVEYCDLPTRYLTEEYRDFLAGDEEIMFAHIRESGEIAKFVSATQGQALTLLIRGGARMAPRSYGNVSDDGVEEYPYDFVYENGLPLDRAEGDFVRFLRERVLPAAAEREGAI